MRDERRGGQSSLSPLPLWLPLLYYSLPLLIPPCPSLTQSLPPPLFFCFTIFPSLPLFIHFQSFSRSAKLPPSSSFFFLSHSSHLSLIPLFMHPHSGWKASFVSFVALSSLPLLLIFSSRTETDLMSEINTDSLPWLSRYMISPDLAFKRIHFQITL